MAVGGRQDEMPETTKDQGLLGAAQRNGENRDRLRWGTGDGRTRVAGPTARSSVVRSLYCVTVAGARLPYTRVAFRVVCRLTRRSGFADRSPRVGSSPDG